MIMLSAMDMDIALMGNAIVTVTGVVRLTVQVTYQAHLLIYRTHTVYVIWGCSMTIWTKGDGCVGQNFYICLAETFL